MEEKYGCKVIILDVMNITLDDIENLLLDVLFEFPVKEINYSLPLWTDLLDKEDEINKEIYNFICQAIFYSPLEYLLTFILIFCKIHIYQK